MNEEVMRILQTKIRKYDTECLTDELLQLLYNEAMTEVFYAAKYNGGKKVRG